MISDRYAPMPTRGLLNKRVKVDPFLMTAYQSIRQSVLGMVYNITGWDNRWTVCITGHSAGGALATLCAFELANRKFAHFTLMSPPGLFAL